jgi:hypothetical protein
MKSKPVASNLLSKTRKNFERDFEKLCKSYGFSMYMAVYGEAIDNDSTRWSSFGYGVCDGLIDMLEKIAEEMREDLDNHGGCDHN